MRFDNPVAQLAHQPNQPTKQQPESAPQSSSWSALVKNALNPALYFAGPTKQGQVYEPISPMTTETKDEALLSLVDGPSLFTEDPIPPNALNIGPDQMVASVRATRDRQDARPSIQATQVLELPLATTPASTEIAGVPEADPTPHNANDDKPKDLELPLAPTTSSANIAQLPETAPGNNATQANASPLDKVNKVATQVGTIATVTGTIAKGVEWLPGGPSVKQNAMGKIHGLGLKVPSLSLGKVAQGAKSLYQMATSIKAPEFIGAALVCYVLYRWNRRPRSRTSESAALQPININVTIPINANVNAPTNVEVHPEPRGEK